MMDNNSGVRSEFQFDSYKIDKVVFEVNPELGILEAKNHSDSVIDYSLGIRKAYRLIGDKKKKYVVGVELNIKIKNGQEKKEVATGLFSITGIFSADDTLELTTEENLVKCQGPAILLPRSFHKL
ncbi:MAG: hypothetical protein R3Y36_06730 [Spirochaetales bacterium]